MRASRKIGLLFTILCGGLVIFVYHGPSLTRSPTSPGQSFFDGTFPATTGKEFSGKKIRTFPVSDSQKRFSSSVPTPYPGFDVQAAPRSDLMCDKWGVMTTIVSPPPESVRRFLYMTDWCVVVVGDLNQPKNFAFESTIGDNIYFLSSDDQKAIENDFVSSLPWRSFGRKNVGYLYAIARGAKVIWDFDDDNFLKFWVKGASVDPMLDISTFTEISSTDYVLQVSEPELISSNLTVFNPYPILGCPERNSCWPRGFPLGDVLNEAWNTTTLKQPDTVALKSFGVLQSLADIQPDVDAIFRMTKTTPLMFDRPEQGKRGSILKIPNSVVVPYNAQATLHFYDAFWALLLPITVAGRVSDIWRSYIGQALFKRLDLSLGFLPRPLVVQERNKHSYEADFIAELPLYVQSRALTTLVSDEYLKITQPITDLPAEIESLWIDLYERGFVDIDDVYLVQKWIHALKSIGYKFSHTHNEFNPDKMLQESFLTSGKSLRELNRELVRSLNGNQKTLTSHCPDDQDSYEPLIVANADLHSGPRADLPSLLSHLGQKTILMGTKGSDTNYPFVYEDKNVKFYNEMSLTLEHYKDHSHKLTDRAIAVNTEFYKDTRVMKGIDLFTCTFPASICQLWLDLNKTVVFLPAHRYNLGRCLPREWHKLDDQIRQLSNDPTKANTVGALSRYDAEYMRYYTGVPVNIMSSLSTFYTRGNKYNPTKKEYLIFCLKQGAMGFVNDTIRALEPEIKARKVYDVYTYYSLNNLTDHPGVIMLPYSVMSYRLTELYSLEIPLFIPSPKFYQHHFDPETNRTGLGHDRTSTSPPYCNTYKNLEEMIRPSVELGFSSHPYSPNIDLADDPESEMYWMQFSDFYDWPHIQLFDSFDHLKLLIQTANLQRIHSKMAEESEIRGMTVVRKWCDVISRVNRAKSKAKP